MAVIANISAKRLNVHICELPKTSESNLPRLPPSARFYAHWKRSFQKLILVSLRHPFTRFFFRSRAAISFERRKHGRSRFWWVIHPCSDVRFCWDVLMTFVFLYIYISVPYLISFNRIAKSAGPEYWDPLSSAYVICIIDIFLNFITGYASPDGPEIFLVPVLITRHYVKGYFMIDLLSSIPYTWFYQARILPPGPDSNSSLLIFEFLPLLKILRILTLRHYIWKILGIFRVSHVQEMPIWLVLLTLLIFHWSTCITHAFPHIMMHVRGESMEKSGAYQFETELYKKSDTKIYLMSLHIGVSNLVGSSFVEMESLGILDKVIRCILLLLGKGYLIYLIVIMLQLVESSAQPELKYQRVMHQVKSYIRDKQLPPRLREKLITYYNYRFQGSYFKEHAISNTLSNHLNQEIAIHSSRGLLETSTILRNLPRAVIGSLMSILKPVIYLEEDIIYKCDTKGNCMYFIISGTVALIAFDGKEICHEQDGGQFGEAALIYTDRKREESVLALEICELLRLDIRDFKRFFPSQSELHDRLESAVKQRSDKTENLKKSPNDFGRRRKKSVTLSNTRRDSKNNDEKTEK